MKRITIVLICVLSMLLVVSCNFLQPPAVPLGAQKKDAPMEIESLPEDEPAEIILQTDWIAAEEFIHLDELNYPPVAMAVNLSLDRVFRDMAEPNGNALRLGYSLPCTGEVLRYAMDSFWRSYDAESYPFADYPGIVRDTEQGVYRIPAAEMEQIVNKVFAVEGLVEELTYSATKYFDQERNEYLYPLWHDRSPFGGHWANFYKVAIKCQQYLLTAEVSCADEPNSEVHTTLILTFDGDDSHNGRLSSFKVVPSDPVNVQLSGDLTSISLAPLGQTRIGEIIGAIDDSIYAVHYRNNELYISILENVNTLSRHELVFTGASASIDESAIRSYIKNEMLFLNLINHTLVLDKDLNVLINEPLPAPISTAYVKSASPDYAFYGNYTIAPDLSRYIYTTSDGVFQFDRSENINSLLLQMPLEEGITLYLCQPNYTADGESIYFSYSFGHDYSARYRYDVNSGLGYSIMLSELNDADLNKSLLRGLGGLFSDSYSNKTYHIAENHLLIIDSLGDYWEYGTREFRICVLGDEIPTEPHFTIEGSSIYIAAVLGDGRVLFSIPGYQAYISGIP